MAYQESCFFGLGHWALTSLRGSAKPIAANRVLAIADSGGFSMLSMSPKDRPSAVTSVISRSYIQTSVPEN
jgi:hypothetical protein